MLNMENAEEVMQILERFTRLKQKEIPKELDDYMHYVAKTGDTVFKWSSLKYLFREKLLNVIKNFHDTSPRVDDLPQYPNVDPFNYESMKSSLLERLELFNAAPFTVQRLCELLTEPRKQYSRIDKFMRALEKNILVSTIEPGRKQTESENGDSLDSVVNGDVSLDVNVDIEMENETIFNAADTPSANTEIPSETTPAQPSSNLIHKADDDILPNPKKAKLDLDETNNAEIEAATKSIASHNTEPTIASVEAVPMAAEEKSDTIIEKKQNDECVSDEKSNVGVENVADEIKKDNKDPEPEKMEEDLADSISNNGTKNEVNSEEKEAELKTTDENTSAPVAQDETQVLKVIVEKIDSTDKQVENVELATSEKKDEQFHEMKEKEKNNKSETESEENKTSEVKTETNITNVIDTENDKQSEMTINETSVLEKAEDKSDKDVKTLAIDAVVEKKKNESIPSTKTQVEETKSVAEKMSDSDEKPEVIEEIKTSIVDSSKESISVVDSTLQNQGTSESSQRKSVEKLVEDKPVEVIEKEIEKTTSAETSTAETSIVTEPLSEKNEADVTKTSPKVENEASEKITTEKNEEKSNDDVSTEVVTPSAVETTEIIPAADKSPVINKSSESTPTPDIVSATTEIPATESSSNVIAAISTSEEATATITADQPMDENPESIAEAEPVVPAIVVEAATNVEEIVMGDTIEMATDAIEPAKDEPAGMEVDDTSQEAMDQ